MSKHETWRTSMYRESVKMKELTLKEISSSIKTGKTPPSKELKYYDGEINWYTPGDLTEKKVLSKSSRTITSLALKERKATIHKQGTLLVGCIGDIGKIGICIQDSSSNQQITGIHPIDEVDVNYLYYWFRGNKQKLASYANNSVVPILNNRILGTVKLPVPPLEEQKKIAAILDAADDYRQKTKALIEKYDQLTQSLFLDMFGDPVTNPMGWEIKSFEEIVSDDCPLTYGIVQPGDEVSDGVPCVRPVDLTQQYVSVDNLKRIDLSISQRFKRTILKGGEILLSVRGSVGVISIADSSLADSSVTRGIVPIWFDKNESSKLFFYYLYKSLSIQRKLSELAKGATLIQLNLKDLRELKLIKPPLDLQNRFAKRVTQIEEQKQQAEASLVKAKELFSSLLQRAFKGELTS